MAPSVFWNSQMNTVRLVRVVSRHAVTPTVRETSLCMRETSE